jgi:hypothetical protein
MKLRDLVNQSIDGDGLAAMPGEFGVPAATLVLQIVHSCQLGGSFALPRPCPECKSRGEASPMWDPSADHVSFRFVSAICWKPEVTFA